MGDGLPRERRLVLEGCRWEWRSISSVPCCGGKAAATSVGPRTSRRRPTHDPTANAAKIQRHAAQSRLRRGDRRRGLCRPLHAASAARHGVQRRACSRRAAASAAPGTGTAIPGARCDVESVQYSYQFSDALQQEWEWSERYAAQPELLRYANHVADRFDLRRDIQFNTRVKAAAFDEAARPLGDRDAATARARRPPSASWRRAACPRRTCPSSRASRASQGDRYHTGYWPHEGVDFTGKRVADHRHRLVRRAVDPDHRRQAKHLTVFQRTPNYAVPAHNAPLDRRVRRQQVKADYPAMRARAKQTMTGIDFDYSDAAALETSAEERAARVRAALAPRRAVVPRRLQGPDGRPGGQRHRGRVRARQDPRAGARSRSSPSCCRPRTPSAASGCASTSATTRPSIGRT